MRKPMGGTDNAGLLSTGVPGLDDIMGGGLTANRIYLVEGEPGAGKTTSGLQFLMEGARKGEPVLYISLAENRDELHAVAASHDWDISAIHIHEVLPTEEMLVREDQFAMFHPAEVEMVDTLKNILTAVDALKPARVV